MDLARLFISKDKVMEAARGIVFYLQGSIQNRIRFIRADVIYKFLNSLLANL